MHLNGFHYPDDANAYETGSLDFERGNGQNPWSRGTVEAIWWRYAYTEAAREHEARLIAGA